MKDLSIKPALTGIGQTAIDLAQYVRFQTTKTEKIAWGVGVSASTASIVTLVASADISLGIGSGVLVSTLGGGALLGSTIFGLYGARQKAPWIGALGGALVGITATGCTILAAPILGGNPVGLTSSAALLGIGGTGGALMARSVSVFTSQPEAIISKPLITCLSGALAGGLLWGGVAGGLFCGLPTIIVAELSAIVSIGILDRMAAFSKRALFTDVKLQWMIRSVHQYSNHCIFADLLNKKNVLAQYNFGYKSISYGELLHKIIDYKAPPKWFKILLKQPEIDLNLPNYNGQIPAYSIVNEFYKSEREEEKKIYLEYLEYLLADLRIDHQNILSIIFIKLRSDRTQNLANMKAIFKVLIVHISSDEIQEQIGKTPDTLAQKIKEIIDTVTEELRFCPTKSTRTAEVPNPSPSEPEEQPQSTVISVTSFSDQTTDLSEQYNSEHPELLGNV